mgnify:CR=1 FL=1|tara:strand:- start:326 stop:1423 length:1098 start_codon:yes stop_codon:yes gene_type:complete
MLNLETILNNWFELLQEQNNILRDMNTSYFHNLSNIYRNNIQNREMTFSLINSLLETQRNNNLNTTFNNTNTQPPTFNTDSFSFPRQNPFQFPRQNTFQTPITPNFQTNNFLNNRNNRNRRNRNLFGSNHRNNLHQNRVLFREPILNTVPSIWSNIRIDNNRQISRNNNNLIHSQTNERIPTQLQIYDSVIDAKWREIKETTNQPICPITQQQFFDDDDVLKIIHCGHAFKKEPLLTWFRRSSLCPVCRYNILRRRFTDTQTNTQTQSTNTSDISRNVIQNNRIALNSINELTTEIVNNLTNDTFLSNSSSDISRNYILDINLINLRPLVNNDNTDNNNINDNNADENIINEIFNDLSNNMSRHK